MCQGQATRANVMRAASPVSIFMAADKGRRFFSWPIILAAVFVMALIVVEYGKTLSLAARGTDNKPTVDFTWTPIGRVSLREMVGKIRVEDDYAIDFSTLKVEIVELRRTIDVTREDVIGKSFEQNMSFAMFDGNLELLKRGQMTLRISVADDVGQETVIERVVKLDVPKGLTPEMMKSLQLMVE